MKDLREFRIQFSGLGLGDHLFEFQIDNKFFEFFEYQEFNKADLLAKISMSKKSNGMTLSIDIEGQVRIPCDISTELYDQPISANAELEVKFGEEFDDSREDVLILPHGEYELNVGQYLYELAVLSVPLKRISPEAEAGLAGSEIREKLEELSSEKEQQDKLDPRWDKLKDLLN